MKCPFCYLEVFKCPMKLSAIFCRIRPLCKVHCNMFKGFYIVLLFTLASSLTSFLMGYNTNIILLFFCKKMILTDPSACSLVPFSFHVFTTSESLLKSIRFGVHKFFIRCLKSCRIINDMQKRISFPLHRLLSILQRFFLLK